MFLRISKNSKRIIAILSKNRTPNQVAWGITLGFVLGIVPKDNLVALALIGMIASLRINQLGAGIAAICLSFMGALFEPITHWLGMSVLAMPQIAASIVALYQYPIMPWLCLENTLVTGGMAAGCLMLLPTYVACRWTVNRAKQQLENIALEQVANDAIQYRKTVADQSHSRREKPAPALKLVTDMEPMSHEAEVLDNASQRSNRKPVFSKKMQKQPVGESVDRQAAKNPMIVDAASPSTAGRTPLERVDSESAVQGKPRFIAAEPTIVRDESMHVGNETILRETVIEVVRYRRPALIDSTTAPNSQDAASQGLTNGESMAVANAEMTKSPDVIHDREFTETRTSALVGTSLAIDQGHLSPSNNRDESLRYLLWHINGTRDNSKKNTEKTA
jgi:uncharacterized protein (TIGR03546 family)